MIRLLVRFFIFAVIFAMSYAPAQAQQAGAMKFDPVSQRMVFFDGSYWYNFSAILATGLCDKPGAMDYDPLLGLVGSYKFCTGEVWMQVTGLITLETCDKLGALDFNGSTFRVCGHLFWVNVKGARNLLTS